MMENTEKIIKYGLYFLWAFMFVAGIIDFLVNNPYSIITWYLDLAFLLFLYFKFKRIPLYFHFIFVIVVIINIFGEHAFSLYYIVPYYDKFLHFLDSLVYCGLAYFLAKPRIQDSNLLVFFSAVAVMAYNALWEIYEFLTDSILGSTSQGVFTGMIADGILFNVGAVQIMDPVTDTLLDMAFNIIGVMVFVVGSLLYQKLKAKDKKY